MQKLLLLHNFWTTILNSHHSPVFLGVLRQKVERTLHDSVNQNEVCVGHFAKKAARLYSVDGVFGALRRDKSWHCENDYAANASKTHRSRRKPTTLQTKSQGI